MIGINGQTWTKHFDNFSRYFFGSETTLGHYNQTVNIRFI